MDYARFDYQVQQHHNRYVRYVNSMPRKLLCQECGGAGGWEETISYELGGPWEGCGWCEGTGFVTPHRRGLWLQCKREGRV